MWSNLRRLLHIFAVIARHLLALLAGDRLGRWPWLAQRLTDGTRPGPERLRMVFEELGGTFIKFGQLLALQPDILPFAYCHALSDLLDRIQPFGLEVVNRRFIEQFGKGPEEIFDRLEPQPIATASIGQVYVAYLDGRKLAVKVRRPNVEVDFASDIRLIVGVTRLIQGLRLKTLYWMIEPLRELVAWTREELDFRCEARYMDQLRRNSCHNAREYVPHVVWPYTTSCILTTEFLEGVTLLNYLRAIDSGDELMARRQYTNGFVPDDFAINLINNFLQDAFQHGMFHADLHPANLMILRGNVVGYVDFGITGVLSSYLRRYLVALTRAYACGDLDGMCDAFFKVSTLDAASDVQGFRRGLSLLATEWYIVEGQECRLLKNFTLVMLDLLKLSRQTSIWPERDVIKYIRSVIAIDGLVTRFAPTFDVGKYLETASERYLKWYVRQELYNFNTLVDWSSSSLHLLRDGALRAAMVLERLATGELPVPTELHASPEASADVRQQAVWMGIFVFAVALLMTITDEKVQLGVNMFTAEVILMLAAATRLLGTLRRLI
jgi:ubiquinone biosynthesis protein